MKVRWLHSSAFDLSWFVAPPLLSALLVCALPALQTGDAPIWAWALLVVGVDVAHVYASLYRTYLDPEEFARRKNLYLWTPFLCWAIGALLYTMGALPFWRALAYLAAFHFVRQQYGFMRMYSRLQSKTSKLDDAIDAAVLYAAMLYPLVFWHASQNREFAWFVQGDFISLPKIAAQAALWLYAALLTAFLARQAWTTYNGEPLAWGKIGIVLSTAAAWFVGIVLYNSDFAFTVTNVIAHGIPYFALTWLYGRRRWKDGWQKTLHKPSFLAAFAGLLIALAFMEEGFWDLAVWHEHAVVFAGLTEHFAVHPPEAVLRLLVPLLALPQAVHYVSDAWIWKFDGSNPGLKENLIGR